jgi:hypothetical protein
VAYVVCAAITYAVWWHKPKDMVTPTTIYLPFGCESDEMPRRAREILDESQFDWVHLSKTFPGDSSQSVLKKMVTFPLRFFIFTISLCLPIKWVQRKKKTRRDSSTNNMITSSAQSLPRTRGTVSEAKEQSATPEQRRIAS